MLIMVVSAPKAHALAGDLDHPSLAFPKDTPAALQTQIMTALNGKEAKFLHGHFINADTTLVYGGNTEALVSMLARLAECEGMQVKVSFVRGAAAESWTLRHNAWADATYIGIKVNLAAMNIDLEKLDLPAFGKQPQKAVPPKQPSTPPRDQSEQSGPRPKSPAGHASDEPAPSDAGPG